MRATPWFIVCILLVMAPALASESPVLSLDELLEQVKQGHWQDQQVNKKRLAQFSADKLQQQALLAEIQQQRADAEALSLKQEQQFETNEQSIQQLEVRLNERLGSLKELFGVLQLVANDAQGQFDNSLVQIHFPKRSQWLNQFSEKMGQTTELPTLEEIERLWFELQQEMTESGKLVRTRQSVLLNSGQERELEVIRIGTFNLIANQNYIQRIAETGRLAEFPRQPARRYMTGAEALSPNTSEVVPFTLDPLRGQLINLMGTTPGLLDRVHQGGVIGYIIIALGALVFTLAVYRWLRLSLEMRKLKRQLLDMSMPGNNALGRIIQTYQNHKDQPLDALELNLGEAVLREVPKFNAGLSFLKISAAMAPLLGLLGTVTGMIVTFQAITLFGAGDPKLMAGGISQALITTVLGLIVAVPTLLLHNFVSDKANRLSQIIEQESIALIALHAEQEALSTGQESS